MAVRSAVGMLALRRYVRLQKGLGIEEDGLWFLELAT